MSNKIGIIYATVDGHTLKISNELIKLLKDLTMTPSVGFAFVVLHTSTQHQVTNKCHDQFFWGQVTAPQHKMTI